MTQKQETSGSQKLLAIKQKIIKIPLGVAVACAVAATAFAFIALVPCPGDVENLHKEDLSYNSATIVWDKVPSAKEYYIYEQDEGKDYKHTETITENRLERPNLETGKTYKYKIVASNYIKTSKHPAKIFVTPTLKTPELSGSLKTGKIELKIKNVEGADSYMILRNQEKYKKIKPSKGDATEFKDSETKSDKKYVYAAVACRNDCQSKPSNEVAFKIKSLGKIKAEMKPEGLFFSWKATKPYTSYKLYNGKKLLEETEDTTVKTELKSGEYDLKLVGYGKDVKSPPQKQKFKITEEKVGNNGVIEAAIAWGEEIADDNSFHYGRISKGARNLGCYFCGTNKPGKCKKRMPADEMAKTWACCEFVTACYVHGGKVNDMSCMHDWIGTNSNSNKYLKHSKNWECEGSVPYSKLKRGDVIMTNGHTVIYIGNGKCLESHGGDDGKPGSKSWNWSIGVHDYSSGRYNKKAHDVWRFVGDDSSATEFKLVEVTDKKTEQKQAKSPSTT